MNAFNNNIGGWVKRGLNIQLYKNSFYLILSRVLTVITGFVFWLLAARLYTTEDVGLAVGLFSAVTLILQFSTFGLESSTIRFLGNYDRSKVINTSLMVTTASAFVFGAGFILLVGVLSPSLAFIQTPFYGTIFLVFVILSSLMTVLMGSFVGIRKAEYNLIQNIVLASRLIFLLVLAFLGAIGVLTAIGLAYILAVALMFYQLGKFIKFSPTVDTAFLKQFSGFFSGNYFANMVYNATYSISPILVLNVLGETASAKYYIAFTIGTFLFQIPYAIGTSLFVEGSHGEALRKNVFRAIGIIYAMLIPGVIFIFLFGGVILSLFGKSYVESVDLLRLIAFSSFFFAIYALIIPIQNVRMKVRSNVVLNVILFTLFVGFSYLFMIKVGVVGVGYAMLATYVIVAAIIACMVKIEGWL